MTLAIAGLPGRPDLAGAPDHPLVRGQFRQRHRAASMQFLRTDADFGAHAELRAVGEGRGSVGVDCCSVDAVQETIQNLSVLGNNGFCKYLRVYSLRERQQDTDVLAHHIHKLFDIFAQGMSNRQSHPSLV